MTDLVYQHQINSGSPFTVIRFRKCQISRPRQRVHSLPLHDVVVYSQVVCIHETGAIYFRFNLLFHCHLHRGCETFSTTKIPVELKTNRTRSKHVLVLPVNQKPFSSCLSACRRIYPNSKGLQYDCTCTCSVSYRLDI